MKRSLRHEDLLAEKWFILSWAVKSNNKTRDRVNLQPKWLMLFLSRTIYE